MSFLFCIVEQKCTLSAHLNIECAGLAEYCEVLKDTWRHVSVLINADFLKYIAHAVNMLPMFAPSDQSWNAAL